MLHIHDIEQATEKVIKGLFNRGLANAETLVKDLLAKNTHRKKLQLHADQVLFSLNKRSSEVGALLQQGDQAGASACRQEIKKLKEKSKTLLQELKTLKESIQKKLLTLPNLPHQTVPIGSCYEDNTILTSWPQKKDLPQHTKPHWELLKIFELASFEQGNKITGAGFPVYYGQGAKLQRGLINFFLDQAIDHGYKEVQTPLIINEASATGTGQIPDKEGIMYALEKKGMYLSPTSEVAVTNLYRGEVFEEKKLPKKHVTYGACFRQEAGSWGRHVRGLNRLHQFDKVELVQIQTQHDSESALEEMRIYVCSLLEKLQLPYRVLKLCTGELGLAAALTYDIEVWSSGQSKWLEVSSITLFNTFQAIRMGLRYKKEQKKLFCHTLNASGLALPRVVAALLECYQKDDCITMPNVLHSYLGFECINKP